MAMYSSSPPASSCTSCSSCRRRRRRGHGSGCAGAPRPLTGEGSGRGKAGLVADGAESVVVEGEPSARRPPWHRLPREEGGGGGGRLFFLVALPAGRPHHMVRPPWGSLCRREDARFVEARAAQEQGRWRRFGLGGGGKLCVGRGRDDGRRSRSRAADDGRVEQARPVACPVGVFRPTATATATAEGGDREGKGKDTHAANIQPRRKRGGESGNAPRTWQRIAAITLPPFEITGDTCRRRPGTAYRLVSAVSASASLAHPPCHLQFRGA